MASGLLPVLSPSALFARSYRWHSTRSTGFAWGPPLSLWVWSMFTLACSDDDPCDRDLEAVASCGREYKFEMCEDDERRCVVHCHAKLECAEFDAFDRGKAPEWLGRCLAHCQQRLSCADGQSVPGSFACDGVEDCADGSDEVECRYFECKNGQAVREDAACDEYAHCEDGSDEEDCP